MKEVLARSWGLIAFFIFFFLGLEFAIRNEYLPEYLFPLPTSVFALIFDFEAQDLWQACTETFVHSIYGFALSFAVGFCLALLAASFEAFRRVLLPLSLFFQTVPIIAIAPLFVIYFGFGPPTVVASSFFVSIFPVIANGVLGLERTPPDLLDLFKLHKVSSLNTLIRLRLPYAYSYFRAGTRISVGLAIIGAIAGEFVAGGGLEALIDSARTQQRIDLVYACLILMSVMALTILAALELVHQWVRKFRPFP